jgi:hypothetical protein
MEKHTHTNATHTQEQGMDFSKFYQFRLRMSDARGPWVNNPRRTYIKVHGEEWVHDTIGVVIRAFDTGEDVEGVEVVLQGRTTDGFWTTFTPEQLNEFLDWI